MMKTFTTALLLCVGVTAFGQLAQVVPADTIPAIIKHTETPQGIRFSSELRPLRQIAGAPEPFYTYFWEFGDGHFSFEKEPIHQYMNDAMRQVRLFATNSYDDGKRPPTRPKTLKPGGSRPVLASNLSPGNSGFFKSAGAIEMKTNCMPKPDEDMVLILGYRNKIENGLASLGGTITILYNDKEFSKDNFQLVEARTYHNETKTPFNKQGNLAVRQNPIEQPYYASLSGPDLSEWLKPEMLHPAIDPEAAVLIKEKLTAYRAGESWKMENLKAGEEKFMFLQFKTTPEMIKDTNAVVRLTGLFMPDSPLASAEFFTLELQIVASHDPNKMMLKNSRMNFRFIGRNKKLNYKVRFQNTGKGPAKKVDVGVAIADVLDMASIKILDSKPKIISCDSAYANQSCLDTIRTTDSVHFVFKNIYLPGLRQKGVEDADSTMGFIEYQISFKDKPKKLPFKSGAAIVFDKNEPIYTNRSVGKYKMGLSPGVIAGYGFPFESGNTPHTGQKNLTFGLSLAPFAPHRSYWQVELYASSFAEKEYLVQRTEGTGQLMTVVIDGKRQEARLKYSDSLMKSKVITLNLVPLQWRHNFNKFVGAGIGTLISVDLHERSLPSTQALFEVINAAGTGQEVNLRREYDSIRDSFHNFKNTLFADIQVGAVRVGPSIGFRYLYTLQGNANRMVTYLTWKF